MSECRPTVALQRAKHRISIDPDETATISGLTIIDIVEPFVRHTSISFELEGLLAKKRITQQQTPPRPHETDMKNTQPHRTSQRSTSVLAGGLLIIAALVLTASGCKKAAPPVMPPPVVQIMEVANSRVPRSTTFIGQLDSPQNVEVRARVEAFVEKILFTDGSEVRAGDLLFELDKKPFEEKLSAAKAALAEANAALSKSKLDVSRLTPLAAHKAVPQRELDAALTGLQVNEANVASAEARLKIGGI